MRSLCGVLLGLWLTACAPVWQKPDLNLLDVRLVGGNLLQQKLRLQLQVRNPNDREIGIEALEFGWLVGGQEFASGRSAMPVTIPARGEGVLELEADARLLGLLRRLPDLSTSDGRVPYRLKGEASIRGYGKLPFDQPGSLDPGRLGVPDLRRQMPDKQGL